VSAGWWADFHFLRPAWLWLLLPLAWLCITLHRRTGSHELLGRFCDPALLPWLTVSLGARQAGLRLLPVVLAGTLAILALAGPVAERLPQPVFREQSALVVMLDLSRSMNAQDLAPSRLARARFKLRDLLASRQRGQAALIVYSDRAFVVTPLTDDVNTIVAQMEVMEPALMPSQGSDPAGAVTQALALLDQAAYPGGDLLLVTDAVSERQRAQIGQTLAGREVRLSVLGVGTPAGAPIPDDDGGFLKDAGGQVVVARFDAAVLEALARAGHGVFAPIAADGRDMDAIGRFLATRATGEVETANERQTEQWHELGPWLLVPVVLLAALAFRRDVVLGALLLPWLAAAPPARAADWWLTPDQAGQRAFEREDYAAAAARYADPAWRAAARYRAGEFDAAAQELAQRDDAESLYNRGNALAKLGRFDEALEAYGRALERAPGHADAKYNKSLIEDLLRQQEQSEQPPEKQREDDSARDEQGGEDGQGQGEGEARQGQAGERESDMTPPSESGDEASKEQDSDAESGQSQASQQDTANGSAGNAATDELAGEDREAEQAEARNDAAGQHEEALAAEQWLRQVPDDPGGLWRRKFRYQYQQKYGGQSGSAEPW
jgi:Ca-activated chloride channel family protein